jgi:hypothetical protein
LCALTIRLRAEFDQALEFLDSVFAELVCHGLAGVGDNLL